jgi:outer membrane biosynthesis protein TonB
LKSVRGLDQAAVEAVKEWQYEAATYSDSRVPYCLTVAIRFSVNALREPELDGI